MAFDPFHKWLGIPPNEQPPNHYRLLGLSLFESDPDVIDAATEQRVSFLSQCATGTHVEESQKLLNAVAAARLCLLNLHQKAAYDARLRARQAPPTIVTSAAPFVTRRTEAGDLHADRSGADQAILALAELAHADRGRARSSRPRRAPFAAFIAVVTASLVIWGVWHAVSSRPQPNDASGVAELDRSPSRPPRLLQVPDIKLAAGEHREVEIRLDRGDFTGPATVRIGGLPAGMEIPDAEIPAARSSAIVDVATDSTTARGQHVITLIVKAGPTEISQFVQLEVLTTNMEFNTRDPVDRIPPAVVAGDARSGKTSELPKGVETDATGTTDEELNAGNVVNVPGGTSLYQFEGHTYAVIKERLDWNSALRRCEELGGHLVTIESDAEWQFLFGTMLRNYPAPTFWLGASDAKKEGDWRWITGKALPRNKWWHRGEPNGARRENYATTCNGLGINDADAAPLFALCEWDKLVEVGY